MTAVSTGLAGYTFTQVRTETENVCMLNAKTNILTHTHMHKHAHMCTHAQTHTTHPKT